MPEFAGAAGGFLQGFMPAFQAGQARQDQLAAQQQQQQRQAQQDAALQQMRDFQMQQAQQQNLQQERARQAGALAMGGGLMGDTGRTPQERMQKFGTDFDPLQYATPQQVYAQTPQQKRADALEDYKQKQLLAAQISEQYKKEGKEPPFVVLENEAGHQIWRRKGQKIPEGYKVSKPSGTVVNIGGEKPVPTEKTRMLTIADSGRRSAKKARDILFKNGRIDSSLVAKLKMPAEAIASGALGEDASELYSLLRGAVSDKLRLESGAVISQDELDEGMRRYLPGVFDSDEVARRKIENLEAVLSDYQKLGSRGVVNGRPSKSTKQEQTAPKTNDPLGIR